MQNRTTDTPLGPVEFLTMGAGPPLLYLHGTSAGNDLIPPLEQRLVKDGFHVVAPNRPGYYGTPLESGRTLKQFTRLMAEFLDAIQLDRVGVVGMSGSGPHAAAFAADYPDRTAALVLMGAITHRWDEPQWLLAGKEWLFPFVRRRATRQLLCRVFRLQTWLLSKFGDAHMKGVCGERFSELADDPDARFAAQQMAAAAVRCMRQPAGTYNDIDTFFASWTLDRIERPTLVIHDPLDPMVPVAHADWAAASVPNAERLDVRLAGHVLWAGADVDLMYRRRSEFLHRHSGAAKERIKPSLSIRSARESR